MQSSVNLDGLSVAFHRTCRVPRVSGMTSALPASLGHFPVFAVKDYSRKAPEHWHREGYFLPMYAHEAMWMSFSPSTPVALLVGAGKVNAVTGKKLEAHLKNGINVAQNYITVPPQPWLDGFKRSKGESVYQFVAAELGKGETAEEQILGSAEFGGIQLGVFKPKIPLTMPQRRWRAGPFGASDGNLKLLSGDVRARGVYSSQHTRDMGLGAGGAITQKIYPDPYLLGRTVSEVWQDEPAEKAFVYIVHSEDFSKITGQAAPVSPITFETYQQQNLPWFGLKDGTWGDVEGGGQAIENLKPVSGGPGISGEKKPSKTVNQDVW